jgi:manganese oxidase
MVSRKLTQRVVVTMATAMLCFACSGAPEQPIAHINGVALAVPNDNREAGGRLRRGKYTLNLEAKLAAWKPDANVDSMVTVQAFAETGAAPRIPGPLLRVQQGTEVRLTVRNSIADSTLIVHNLRAGTVPNDTVRITPGTVRELTFRATKPGTYLYWGTTRGSPIDERWSRDSQLTGAIVVDAAGTKPNDRIFVLTLIDIYADPSRPPTKEDIWEVAINGLSWPHTERLQVQVGDTARWRWLNGTDRSHPMHLHGFHFRVLAKGNGSVDSIYESATTRLGVTELMEPGSTFHMEWLPTRPGNWLMHCHMLGHITPFPERADSTRRREAHDIKNHALTAMAGLVLGITSVGAPIADDTGYPGPPYRLLLQQSRSGSDRPIVRGFAIARTLEVPTDSVEVPGPPLLLERGKTSTITVINRLAHHTSIHWHGMELQSVYDGVAGWSGAGANRAPMIAPGDSFTVRFTPPRAGTYIYHSHMDEEDELQAGMYGALLVLEPNQTYDPARDLTLVIGETVIANEHVVTLNGKPNPPPLALQPGITYRLRIINILPVDPLVFELLVNDQPVHWLPISKDGAALPVALQKLEPARKKLGVGETYDFEWTPAAPAEARLIVRPSGSRLTVQQRVLVGR